MYAVAIAQIYSVPLGRTEDRGLNVELKTQIWRTGGSRGVMDEDFLRNNVIAERQWNDWCCHGSAIDRNTRFLTERK
jgi:hypothetical protein